MEPFCENCKNQISFRIRPYNLTCCGKKICHDCCDQFFQVNQENLCSFCGKKLSLVIDIKLIREIISSKLLAMEGMIDRDHRLNFKKYQQNLKKIQKFYMLKRPSCDSELVNGAIRLLRKDQEKKIHSFVTEASDYQQKFKAFRMQIITDSVFLHNNLSQMINLVDMCEHSMSKMSISDLTDCEIKKFCCKDPKDILREKNFNTLKFLLEYKEIMSEHFSRVYTQLISYLDFLKKLDTLFLNEKESDQIKFVNEDLKIKILFKNKIKYCRDERNQLIDMFVNINTCIDNFYADIRDGRCNKENDLDHMITRINGFLKFEFNDVFENSIFKIDMSNLNFFAYKISFENFKQIYTYPNDTKRIARNIIEEYKIHRTKVDRLNTFKYYGKAINYVFITIDILKIINYFIMLAMCINYLNTCSYMSYLLPITMILFSICGIFFISIRTLIIGYIAYNYFFFIITTF